MYTVQMDMVQTIGLAVVMLIIGRVLKKHIKFFQTYCIPSPVIGGFLFAIIHLIVTNAGFVSFEFDETLRKFFMTIFFTSIGFNASWRLLKLGGIKVIIFLMSAVGLVVLQNFVAVGVGKLLNIDLGLALLTGSTSMTGGHGTAAAIGPLVEEMGVTGAQSVAIAAATFGLIAGSALGGPLANFIIKHRKVPIEPVDVQFKDVKNLVSDSVKKLDNENFAKALFMILFSMFIGTYISQFLENFMTFPSYIGSMLVAAVIRNISDNTKYFNVHYAEIRVLENVSLSLFLGIAMMTLKLWELSSVAGPLIVLLTAQVLLLIIYVPIVTYKLMGSNYDAVVLCAGHTGFALGATPNGMANMQSVCEKYAYSKVAFFVLPLVGAMFIDFVNIPIIGLFIEFIK